MKRHKMMNRKVDRENARKTLSYEEWKEQSMSGGNDARTLRGRKDDQWDRFKPGLRTSPSPARNGAPTYQSKHLNKSTRKGVGEGAQRIISRAPDEIDRAGAGVKTHASVRNDVYTDRGPSEAAGGPTKSRSAARSYTDRTGPVSS